jgi:hypothetical protein
MGIPGRHPGVTYKFFYLSASLAPAHLLSKPEIFGFNVLWRAAATVAPMTTLAANSFGPLLRDLAAHADKATARSTAKNTEYPTAHLQLAGSAWPWRPTALAALTIAAAIGAALLPAAAARRHRP